LAMAVIQTRANRNHPHARFLVGRKHIGKPPRTTTTRRRVTSFRQRPPILGFNHDAMLVLELRPHDRLVVASYKGRQVHVTPLQEAPRRTSTRWRPDRCDKPHFRACPSQALPLHCWRRVMLGQGAACCVILADMSENLQTCQRTSTAAIEHGSGRGRLHSPWRWRRSCSTLA
jgi:hypothetical protein